MVSRHDHFDWKERSKRISTARHQELLDYIDVKIRSPERSEATPCVLILIWVNRISKIVRRRQRDVCPSWNSPCSQLYSNSRQKCTHSTLHLVLQTILLRLSNLEDPRQPLHFQEVLLVLAIYSSAVGQHQHPGFKILSNNTTVPSQALWTFTNLVQCLQALKRVSHLRRCNIIWAKGRKWMYLRGTLGTRKCSFIPRIMPSILFFSNEIWLTLILMLLSTRVVGTPIRNPIVPLTSPITSGRTARHLIEGTAGLGNPINW